MSGDVFLAGPYGPVPEAGAHHAHGARSSAGRCELQVVVSSRDVPPIAAVHPVHAASEAGCCGGGAWPGIGWDAS